MNQPTCPAHEVTLRPNPQTTSVECYLCVLMASVAALHDKLDAIAGLVEAGAPVSDPVIAQEVRRMSTPVRPLGSISEATTGSLGFLSGVKSSDLSRPTSDEAAAEAFLDLVMPARPTAVVNAVERARTDLDLGGCSYCGHITDLSRAVCEHCDD